jgi:hypothetical protein
MLTQVDLPVTVRAPAIARRVAEHFIQFWPRPVPRDDQLLAVWLTSELVSKAVEYSSTESNQVGLRLRRDGASYIATLAGADGVNLLAHELTDRTMRSRGVELFTEIADRWGSYRHHDGDHVWIELDLSDESPDATRPPADGGRAREQTAAYPVRRPPDPT